MDAVEQNQERWVWLGQGAALDLADTVVKNREGAYEDLLRSFADLQGWLAVEQRWLPERYELSPADLPHVLALRAAVRGLFLARVESREPHREDIDTVNACSAMSPARLELEFFEGSLRTVARRLSERPIERFLALIAEDAISLLGGSDASRLAICPAPSCGMFYVQARGNQRWCTDACGNRARVARYQRRRA